MRALALLAAVLAASPALAHGVGWWVEATTQTGDADHHFGGALCGSALRWPTMRLALLDPAPGDAVLLVVDEEFGYDVPTGALATYEAPVVHASELMVLGCEPSVWVVGLTVNGERPYRLEWVPQPPLPAVWPLTG